MDANGTAINASNLSPIVNTSVESKYDLGWSTRPLRGVPLHGNVLAPQK